MKHLPSYNVCYHRLGDNTEGTCLITYPTAEPSPTDRINSFNIQDHATKDRSPQQKVDGLTSTKEDILKRKCPNDSDINEAQELLKHDDCQDPSTQNSTSEPSPTDQTPDPSPQQEAWQKIHDITLTKEDRDDVLKRKWLNDSVINAAQDLLKHDHGLLPVESLQNTLLIPIRQSDIVCYEGVQILNSCRNHWITISTVGQSANQPTVRIYDSLNTELPSDTKQEIADLLNTNKSEITFERMPVQVNLP